MRQAFAWVLRRWLPKNGFARKVSILTGGTALAQLLAIALSPLLTRIYAPSSFGVLQLFISLMALALVASGGRYEVAVLLPEEEQAAVDVLALALLCVCFVTCAVSVVVGVCHVWWILPRSLLALRGYLWLLPFSILGAGIYQVLSYWALRRNAFGQIAGTKFTQAGAQIGTQVGAGIAFHGNVLALLGGDAVGRIVGSGAFIRHLWAHHSEQVRAVRWNRMRDLAVRYRNYPLVSMWGALINASGLALPSLFLGQYYSVEGIGWFALVNRVLGVPSALVGQSIAQVYTAEAARLVRDDPNRLLHVFVKTTRRMLLLGTFPCAIFIMAAPALFQFIFGAAWREAGEFARYLALMFYASFVNSPVSMTLNIMEKQTSQFIWDASRLVVTAASIATPYYLHWGVRDAVASYGAGMTLMYAVHWLQSYFALRKAVLRHPQSTKLAGAPGY